MTEQVPDILQVDGNILLLKELPLSLLLAQRDTAPDWRAVATCCLRGYVGSWRIDDSRLYLDQLRSFQDACNSDGYGATLLASVPAFTVLQSPPAAIFPMLQAVFPDANGPVFADWYSGPLICPFGDVIHQTGGGYFSFPARERRFWVDQGRIVGDRIRDNQALGLAPHWLEPRPDVADVDSCLPRPLIVAYRGTAYRAKAGNDLVDLRIGTRSNVLLDLYDWQTSNASAPRSATFITGWNPFSEDCCDQENAAANAALEGVLKTRGHPYFHGEGHGSDQIWAPEASFLAIGLTRQAAIDLGRRYDQNAIVFASEDAVPHLLLLR